MAEPKCLRDEVRVCGTRELLEPIFYCDDYKIIIGPLLPGRETCFAVSLCGIALKRKIELIHKQGLGPILRSESFRKRRRSERIRLVARRRRHAPHELLNEELCRPFVLSRSNEEDLRRPAKGALAVRSV